jgi:hypothetical protein
MDYCMMDTRLGILIWGIGFKIMENEICANRADNDLRKLKDVCLDIGCETCPRAARCDAGDYS